MGCEVLRNSERFQSRSIVSMGKPYDAGKDMATNSPTEPPVQVSDPAPPEEASGFTPQQLRFLRQLVQGQPQEEAPRTQDPSPGATHGVHILPMGRAG